MLQDCFRVSIGTPEENDQLIAVLEEIFARKEKSILTESS
jgi:histidinol-phosphate/aromatic aminotransferase/cobyric acid decarboxylase-like protein